MNTIKRKTTSTITYAEILSRALSTLESEIEEWKAKTDALPLEQQERERLFTQAFSCPEKKQEPIPEAEQKRSPKAVDRLEIAYEVVKSADGFFSADLDYESEKVDLLNSSVGFDKLPELVSFVVGLAGRVSSH